MMTSLQACISQSADNKGAGSEPSTAGNGPLQWLSNMNDAYAQSVKDNKPILAYFTSSDTCGLCKQMDAAVFSTPVFKTWAGKNVVLYELDFSKDKQLAAGSLEQNTGMANYLKVSGYPVVWIIYITH
jgi:protein disulfide-isomerase